MNQVTVQTPAKINLALDITGVTGNGYHLMEMVMQSIDLCDTLRVSRTADTQISLSCPDPAVPCDEKNICYRCAELFFRHAGIAKPEQGVLIAIEKHIPKQAGMAGGSANGAGTLLALNRLYQTGYGLDTLCALGKQAGADIPFCLAGGTAKVEGIGEKITPLPTLPDCDIVIAKPRGGISTGKAFAAYDALGEPLSLPKEALFGALAKQDIAGIAENLYNVLEQVSGLHEISVIKNMMYSGGAKGAVMTGSGSAVFGIFTDRRRAFECEAKLKERYDETFLCKPVNFGARIV